ncbi:MULTISPECIES: MFS transporter [Ralstonia solanacearum species complex]|uniref:MFS transporter n=1 Tax=Ralstonia solanacearum species complex TaxID=3116862 RepID=UPI001F09FDB1|nr:MFS transporter [Ralstonia solanacearum]
MTREAGTAGDVPAGRALSPSLVPITALVTTSVIAQIGQYGIGFVVLPLWLTQHHASAMTIEWFASCEWAGMLAGITLAPKLIDRSGFGRTVLYGLLLSLAGFGVLAWRTLLPTMLGASLIGLGMGLRWIGAETPLFRATPARWRGRIVGLHELLVAGAAMFGPVLGWLVGLTDLRPLMVGGRLIAVAGLPMIAVVRWPPMLAANPINVAGVLSRTPLSGGMRVGVAIGIVAGLCNGALYGLLPQFAHARAMTPEATSNLLVSAGVGAALSQYPVGWLADRLGLTRSAMMLGSIALVASAILLTESSRPALTIAVLVLAGAVRALLTLATYAAAMDDAGRADRNMRIIAARFSVGAILGPLCAGMVMRVAGANMLPGYFFALCGCLTLYTCSMALALGRRRHGF